VAILQTDFDKNLSSAMKTKPGTEAMNHIATPLRSCSAQENTLRVKVPRLQAPAYLAEAPEFKSHFR